MDDPQTRRRSTWHFLLTSAIAVAIWVGLIGFAVATYVSRGYLGGGRGVGPMPAEFLCFTCAFSAASLVSAFTTLALAGRTRVALPFASSAIASVGIVSALVAILFWLTPSITWPLTRLNWWEFRQLREDIASVAAMFASFCVPVALTVGFVVGAPAGVVVHMIRKGSRLGIALALCLVLIVLWRTATTSVISAGTEWLIDWHRSGRFRWYVEIYVATVLAAFYGAVAGALLGGIAASYKEKRVRSTRPPGCIEKLEAPVADSSRARRVRQEGADTRAIL